MKTEKIKDSYSDEVRLALLEQSINNINDTMVRFERRFDQIDAKFDHIDSKFNHIDAKFNHIDSKFEQLRAEGRSQHKWTLSLISGLYFIFASSLTTILLKFVH